MRLNLLSLPRMGFTWASTWNKANKDSLVHALRGKGLTGDRAAAIANRVGNKAWKVAALKVNGKHFGKEFLLSGSGALLGMHIDVGSEGWRHAKQYLKF